MAPRALHASLSRPLITHHDFLLLLLALLPALSRWWLPGLPDGADTASHFFRAVELDWLVRNGILYPRWLPDFVFGYGYPLFNFYGPLSAYLIALLHAIGLPFTPAALAAFGLADLLGALGVYLLGREVLGRPAGLTAALAYAYSPYTLGSLHRGTLPEALAFGLLPLTLWAFYRLWHAPSFRRLALSALLFALLPLANNPGAALAGAILAAFLAALWVANRPARGIPVGLKWGLLALALGLALSAFFWLPLVLELRHVQIERAYSPALLDFRNNFLSPARLFPLPQPTDPGLIGGATPSGLGLPQLGLALVGLAVLRSRVREQKVLLAAAAIAALALALLTLPESAPVWERVPGLRLIQFPARLLGPASLMLALLAGSSCSSEQWPRWAPLAIASFILFGFGWMYAGLNRAIPAQPTLLDIHAHEHRTGSAGTTTALEFLPIWVEQKPPDESLQDAYARSPIIARLDRASLPAGAAVLAETPGLLSQTATIDSPDSFEAVFNLFYFPGWTARVDGRPVPIAPTVPAGLAAFPVPAGRHSLTLRFEDTPPRSLGNLVSLAVLAVLAALASLEWRRQGVRGDGPDDRAGGHGGLPASQWAAIAVVGLGALVLKTAIVDRTDNPFRQNRFDGQTVKGVETALDLTFGDQIQLLGYEAHGDEVVLYWRALRALDDDWSVSVTLEDEGRRVAQDDAQHPAGLPTRRWFPDQYARDPHRLTPIPGTLPGAYDLRVTVYRQSDGLILQPASITIGEWQVARPAQPAVLEPPQAARLDFGDIELTGVDIPARVEVGHPLPVTFYWRATGRPAADLELRWCLSSPDRSIQDCQSHAPGMPGFGTSQWRAGDQWVSYGSFPVDADYAAGEYEVTLASPGLPAPLGRVQIAVPDRLFEPPPIANPVDVQFGTEAKLLGWARDGQGVTLYWQPLEIIFVSYKVFVHALDADGTILAQHDSLPAQGARLTPSWLPPEIVVDSHPLPLPPETARLRVGLYDPVTGRRLPLADGDEFVMLEP